MKLQPKEAGMVEKLRQFTDGVFIIVKQGGEVRQVARRLKKDIDVKPSGRVFSAHDNELTPQPVVEVILISTTEN